MSAIHTLPYERIDDERLLLAVRLFDGEHLLCLRPFGWHIDGRHIPNAPEQFSRRGVCEEHGWIVVCDYGPYIAVVRSAPFGVPVEEPESIPAGATPSVMGAPESAQDSSSEIVRLRSLLQTTEAELNQFKEAHRRVAAGYSVCAIPIEHWKERAEAAEAKLQTTEAARPLPDRSSRPQDTYHWGETMAQYAALGIGVDAWVELQRIERDGIRRQNNDLSGMLISWRTFVLVMKVLRAIRIEDFKELETLRTRIVAAESRLSSLEKEQDEAVRAFEGFALECAQAYGAAHLSTPEIVGIVARCSQAESRLSSLTQAHARLIAEWRRYPNAKMRWGQAADALASLLRDDRG